VLQVPDDILHDEALNEAISLLPANYNFEVRRSESFARGAAAAGVGLHGSIQQHLYLL
jgi:2-(3-amino-3-carboxypropyl)histidine synthase